MHRRTLYALRQQKRLTINNYQFGKTSEFCQGRTGQINQTSGNRSGQTSGSSSLNLRLKVTFLRNREDFTKEFIMIIFQAIYLFI